MGLDWGFKMWRKAKGRPDRWSLLDTAIRVETYARDAPRSLSYISGETRREESFYWIDTEGKPRPSINIDELESVFFSFGVQEARDGWQPPSLHVFANPARPLDPWSREPVETLDVGFRDYDTMGDNAKLDQFITLCLAEIVVRMDPDIAAGGVEASFNPTPDEVACGYPRYEIPEIGYFPPAVVGSTRRAVWDQFAHLLVDLPGLVSEDGDEPERGSLLHLQNGGILYRRAHAEASEQNGVLLNFMRSEFNILV